jgi:hypothetical protein
MDWANASQRLTEKEKRERKKELIGRSNRLCHRWLPLPNVSDKDWAISSVFLSTKVNKQMTPSTSRLDRTFSLRYRIMSPITHGNIFFLRGSARPFPVFRLCTGCSTQVLVLFVFISPPSPYVSRYPVRTYRMQTHRNLRYLWDQLNPWPARST